MSLPDVYPDAESVCIRRSIHGVRKTSNNGNHSGIGEDTSDVTGPGLHPSNLSTQSSSWGRAKAGVKVPHFVVDMTDKNTDTWVTKNLKKKECIKYVPDPKQDFKQCQCGRLPRQHCEETDFDGQHVIANRSRPQVWDKDGDTREYPTDANGQIYFRNSGSSLKPAKYVRISDNTDPKLVLKTLTEYWRLPIPQLVISVAGGLRNFKLNSQDQATFNRGLIKATNTVGVWLITEGTNAGVAKAVGKSMREWRSMSRLSKQEVPNVALIGIPPWAYVAGIDHLINQDHEAVRSVSYKVDPIERRGHPAPLNPDHTHFILIDDGRRNKYGGNVTLSAKIQELIGEPKNKGGLGVPVVTVLVEGGLDALRKAFHSIKNDTPIILCDGTGRATDLLSYAHRHSKEIDGIRQLDPFCLPTLQKKIHVLLQISPDTDQMEDVVNTISACMVHEHLITVFEMQKGEHLDLDLAILTALLKCQEVTPINQLSLAVSWNRVDVAETKIFTDDFSIPAVALHPFITDALVNNRVDFLRLFIERGAIMKDYLTVARLRRLYNSAPDTCYLRTLLDNVLDREAGEPIFLHDIGILIKDLTGAHHEPLYTNDRHYRQTNRETRALLVLSTSLTGMNILHCAQEEYIHSNQHNPEVTTGAAHLSLVELANPGMHFEHPFRELFIWAVLMDRPEMGAFLWEHCNDPVSCAIAASSILTSMADSHTDPDDQAEYLAHAKKFEELAISVIDVCHDTHEEFAQKLVSLPRTRWGDKTIVDLAAETNDMNFIAHPCCQGIINDIWYGGINSSTPRILLAVLIPFLIPFLIRFKDEDSFRTKSFSSFRKAVAFHKAPITTFFLYLASYAVFLILYSMFMLFYLDPEPTYVELFLFIWIVTMSVDELREAFVGNEGMRIPQKLAQWFKSDWNKLDFLLMIIAITAFGIHWYPPAFPACQALYAIDCMLYYIRMLRLFAVNPRLGPQLVMIRKMMIEMLIFLCILGVFLLGYGVASQGLLYPDQEPGWFSLKNAIYVPYFQIYGELFLDVTVHGDPHGCGVEGGDPCPVKNGLVIVLMAVYLIVGNVLLLNLLIAIFSHVFTEIQTNAMVIWKYEQYSLVYEFRDKAWLPAPLGILVHLYSIFSWLLKQCSSTMKGDIKDRAQIKMMERNLQLFETECAAKYRRHKAEEMNADVAQRVTRLEKGLSVLTEMLSKHISETKLGDRQDSDRIARSLTNQSAQYDAKSGSQDPVLPPPRGSGDNKMAAMSTNNPSSIPPEVATTAQSSTRDVVNGVTMATNSSHVNEDGRLVDHRNAINRHLHQPGSPMPRINPQLLNIDLSEMEAFLQARMGSPGGSPHSDRNSNLVLEHTVVEQPFMPLPSVRSPPEGGNGPTSSRSRSGSRKKRKKKKVAPLDVDRSDVTDEERLTPRTRPHQSGQNPGVPSPNMSSPYPTWYQRSAFETIPEKDEEEQQS